MQAHLAGIHFGEEVPAEEEDQASGKNAKTQEGGDENAPVLHGAFQRSTVAFTQLFKFDFEALLKPSKECGWRFVRVMLVSAQQVHDQGWDDGSRKQIRREHGENYGFRQRHEEIS